MSRVFRAIVVVAMVLHQAVEVAVGDENDVPAFAAVPAIGAAQGHMFLPTKTNHSVAAIAAAYIYLCPIVKHINLYAPAALRLI